MCRHHGVDLLAGCCKRVAECDDLEPGIVARDLKRLV